MTTDIDLCERIKSWRKHKGLSQEAVADQLGISAGAVGYWETGDTKPTHENLERLATDVFKVTMAQFWGDIPGPTRKKKAKAA